MLEDAGDPAHVRNDFRGAYLGDGGSSAVRSRLGVRALRRRDLRPSRACRRRGDAGRAARRCWPTSPPPIAQGLADRTQRRFFSDGTLPEDVVVDRDTTGAEVMRDARDSLPYGLPRAAAPRARGDGRRALRLRRRPSRGGAGRRARKRRLLAYLRVPGRVRFFLDRAVYHDTRPRAAARDRRLRAPGSIDHLFRAEIHLDVEAGAVAVSVDGRARRRARAARCGVYAEDARRRRRAVRARAGLGDAGDASRSPPGPAGSRRCCGARTTAGELVAVAEQPIL